MYGKLLHISLPGFRVHFSWEKRKHDKTLLSVLQHQQFKVFNLHLVRFGLAMSFRTVVERLLQKRSSELSLSCNMVFAVTASFHVSVCQPWNGIKKLSVLEPASVAKSDRHEESWSPGIRSGDGWTKTALK